MLTVEQLEGLRLVAATLIEARERLEHLHAESQAIDTLHGAISSAHGLCSNVAQREALKARARAGAASTA
jgi:hypothetical protein